MLSRSPPGRVLPPGSGLCFSELLLTELRGSAAVAREPVSLPLRRRTFSWNTSHSTGAHMRRATWPDDSVQFPPVLMVLNALQGREPQGLVWPSADGRNVSPCCRWPGSPDGMSLCCLTSKWNVKTCLVGVTLSCPIIGMHKKCI